MKCSSRQLLFLINVMYACAMCNVPHHSYSSALCLQICRNFLHRVLQSLFQTHRATTRTTHPSAPQIISPPLQQVITQSSTTNTCTWLCVCVYFNSFVHCLACATIAVSHDTLVAIARIQLCADTTDAMKWVCLMPFLIFFTCLFSALH